MDRKIRALEAELKSISEATETMSDLLKILNNMASKQVETCKCISKSKATEKLAAYMEATKVLAEIKGRIVADSVTLESYLISIGYIEDEESEEADNADTNTNQSSIAEIDSESVDANIAGVASPEERLQADCKASVRFTKIPCSINIESININPPDNSHNIVPEVSSANIATDVFTLEAPSSSKLLQTSDNLDENVQRTQNIDDVSKVQTDIGTNPPDLEKISNTTKPIPVNLEEYFKDKKIMSLEDKYVNSLLQKSCAPDLRLQRSSSPSSSSSILSISTKSSNKSDIGKKSKPKDVNSTMVDIMPTCLQKEKGTSLILLNGDNANVDHHNLVVADSITLAPAINLEISEDTRNRSFPEPCCPRVDEICIISCLKNPQKLYIQLFDQADSLLALNENLNATYEKSLVQYRIKSNAKEQMGNNCVAYVEDYQSWYRVQVLDWQLMSHTNTVLVFLIDYGDVLKVPVEVLRKLMSEFFDYPKFAVHCSLESLYPPSSLDNNINTIWTTAELNAFYEFMKDGNQMLYRLTYINGESDPIGIDLINAEDTNLENSLGQELIDANIVKQILFDEVKLIPDNSCMLEQIKSIQGLQGTSKNMTETEVLEKYLDNNLYKEAENIVEEAAGYDANDERRVCKFTRKDGTCFKGLNCKLEHIQLRPDGFTTDKNYVYHKALYTYILPCVDDDIRIYLTFVTRPNEFYGHILERDEMRIYGTSLRQLAADLKNPLAIKRFERLQLQPTVGQIVLAKNWDGTWCRGRVIEIDGLSADIFIVDYGETVTVNINDDLREISRDYLVLPFQAVKFCLWDLEKVPAVSEEKIIDYMDSQYLCNEFTATVRACNPHLYVDIRIGDIDMSTDLISLGFGRRTFGKQLIIETTLVD